MNNKNCPVSDVPGGYYYDLVHFDQGLQLYTFEDSSSYPKKESSAEKSKVNNEK